MSEQRWRCVALVLLGTGCTPYIMKDNVVGPHGEPLIELACATPDQCMSFAREVCRGDFDVATNDFYAAGGMLVHCQNPPGPPPAPVRVPPDAGP